MAATLKTYFMASDTELAEALSSEKQYKHALFKQPVNFQKLVATQRIEYLESY
jgi:hypothetical protein